MFPNKTTQPSALDAINNNSYQAPAAPQQQPQAQAQGPGMSGSYWIGADGNVWHASASGTKNMGKPINTSMGGFDAQFGSAQAGSIADPMRGGGTTNTVDSGVGGGGGGGGGGGTIYQDTTQARNATNTTINSLDTILNNNLKESQGEYDELLGAYNAEEVLNQATYDKQVVGNETTREAQNQAALLAAANGGRGLTSILSSIGALGGTGKTLANRAVANEANMDIGNANKTFDSNATTLFDSFGKVKQQEEQRKKDAKTTFKKTQQKQKYDITDQRQKLYKEMAGLWKDSGNFGEADASTAKASSLTSDLVANTAPNVGTYARSPVEYSAPALDSYLAGANDMTVSADSTSAPINGAIYTATKPREKELA